MNRNAYWDIVASAAEKLSDYESARALCLHHREGEPFPSESVLREITDLCRSLIFPGYFGYADINGGNIAAHTGINTERLYVLLSEQILAGLCFSCDGSQRIALERMGDEAARCAAEFIARLPELREILYTDVVAAYNGDPAAESYGEVIFCYPAIRAVCNYRIAHELLRLKVPLIPRMITEMAHSETGIDIHPAASVGSYFSIDHGTGVVIGATAVIGNGVKLYQGVTLGAKSFPLDEKGNPIKGILRHPIIGDNVIIYSNASILGRVTVGDGAVIGGNVWVTEDVPAGARVMQMRAN